MQMNGKIVHVGKFVNSIKRKRADSTSDNFTNVYVKNFDKNLDEDELKVYFEVSAYLY